MTQLLPALYSEMVKVIRSKVLPITIIFFVFIGAMMSILMLAAKHPEITGASAILSTKASFISEASWTAYFSLLQQLVLVLSLLGPGVVIIWLFGREYTDRTLKEIMALPVSRTTLATAKFITGFTWSFILVICLLATALIAGSFIGLSGIKEVNITSQTMSMIMVSILTITLTTPFAFITCAARGLLLPIALIILVMIITQFLFAGFPEATRWFPWAIPALYSGVTDDILPYTGYSGLLVVAATSAAGIFATIEWWKRSDHH